ncbi:phosphopantetheine-binding protein [Streptomyces sp. NPDC048197]|uniref:phosphopantetheine-binding protein n=1 Tax=Streptomyces sp. NPDC048197 TaxID=3365511 RepID=UPI00371919F9
MEFNADPSLPSSENSADVAENLWREILGAGADPAKGFLENGGDSFRAVLLTSRLYELTGREVEYLDVLEADGVGAVARLLAADGAGS